MVSANVIRAVSVFGIALDMIICAAIVTFTSRPGVSIGTLLGVKEGESVVEDEGI